ncbi:hypothetical protein ACRRTK_003050 [Alexandromys fortis]
MGGRRSQRAGITVGAKNHRRGPQEKYCNWTSGREGGLRGKLEPHPRPQAAADPRRRGAAPAQAEASRSPSQPQTPRNRISRPVSPRPIPLGRHCGDSEGHARRPPTGPPVAATPASRRAAATALPRFGRDLRGLPRSPRELKAASPRTARRPTVGSRLHQHSPAAAKPKPEPLEAGRGQRGARSGREEPQEPQSKPEGRGAGRWPLPRRPLEGRHEGGASLTSSGRRPSQWAPRRGWPRRREPIHARPCSSTSPWKRYERRAVGGARVGGLGYGLPPADTSANGELQAASAVLRWSTAFFPKREDASVRRTRPGCGWAHAGPAWWAL